MQKSLLTSLLHAFLLLSCATTHTTDIAERTTHDTLHQHQQHYDSIYTNHFHSQEYHPSTAFHPSPYHPDTLVIRDSIITFKYRQHNDTTYIHRTDTIPIIQYRSSSRLNLPLLIRHPPSIAWFLLILTVLWYLRKGR